MHLSAPLVLSGLLLLAPAPFAQDPASRVIGRIVAQGAALPEGLVVHAVGRPLGAPTEAEPLRLEAAVAASGRFALELPAHAEFAVWAEAPAADGQVRMSELWPRFGSAQRLRLELRPEPRSPRALELRGLDAWAHRGPVTVLAGGDSALLPAQPLARTESGHWSLPPLPGERCFVTVQDAAGRVLECFDVHAQARERVLLELPPPLRVRVTVLEDARDVPIAGAELGYRLAAAGRRDRVWSSLLEEHEAQTFVARTDAKGHATLELPWAWPSKDAAPARSRDFVFVRAAGRILAAGRLTGDLGPRTDGTLLERRLAADAAPETPPELVFRLPPSVELRGRVLDGGGAPIAGLAIAREQVAFLLVREGMWSYERCPPLVVRTGPDGRFAVPGYTPGLTACLFALPTAEQLRRLSVVRSDEAEEDPLATTVWLTRLKERPKGTALELGEFGPASLQPLALEVTAASGRPASGAEVWLHGTSGPPQFLRTDRRGRASILHPPGERSSVLVVDPDSGWQLVDPSEEEDGEPLQVALERPFGKFSGRVLDAEGKAVAGATVTAKRWKTLGSLPTPIWHYNRMHATAVSASDGSYRIRMLATGKMLGEFGAEAPQGSGSESSTLETISDDAKRTHDFELGR